MARTKQTARKSTGSKASRKQPPPPPPNKISSLSASASASASASTTTTNPTETTTTTKKDLSVQQQRYLMRAESLEKELERNRQRQIEIDNPNPSTPKSILETSMRQYMNIKDNPTPESIAAEENNNNYKEGAASVHELLYQDSIDYTGGERLVDAFKSYKPLLRSNNEYIKLYGINVEEIVEENDDLAYDSVIGSINKVIIKGNYESSTMFKDKKKCSVTTITQEQAQIKQEQELQEDYNNIKEINTKNNNNNVFNELITYYNNGGSDLKQKKMNDYFS